MPMPNTCFHDLWREDENEPWRCRICGEVDPQVAKGITT